MAPFRYVVFRFRALFSCMVPCSVASFWCIVPFPFNVARRLGSLFGLWCFVVETVVVRGATLLRSVSFWIQFWCILVRYGTYFGALCASIFLGVGARFDACCSSWAPIFGPTPSDTSNAPAPYSTRARKKFHC